MLRGPDLTGSTTTVPALPIPTRNVSATPTAERSAASDAFRGTPEMVVVRQGDTLGSIAARYHVSLKELKELNPDLFTAGRDAHGRKRAENGHWIYPGDQVRLRTGTGTASSSPSTESLTAQVRAAQASAKQTGAESPKTEPEVASQPKTQDSVTQASVETTPDAVAPPTAPVTPMEQAKPEPAPKQPEPPAKPTKTAHVIGVEHYEPHPKPASPPPVPTTMAEGQRLNKNEKLIIGGLLAGLSLIKMPAKIEQSIGDNAVDEVLAKSPLYTRNPEIVRYVASVGAKLVNQSDRTDLDWRFYVVQSDQVNAFALPGGHVFITTAALRNLKSESELAGVLGHEIAHVEKRHSVKQLQKTLLAQGIAIAALGDQSAGVQVASQLAIGIAMNGYSRSNEEEADLRGAELAYQAGYDPKGLVHFFETLKQVHPDSPEWMAWVSDHPQTGDRIEHVTAHIAKQGLTGHDDPGADRYRQVMSRL
ncbi:MAG TPA: M48 family metalloprotease [Stenomitos sp.]